MMNDHPDSPVALAAPPTGYADWLAELKTRIHTAQQRAALAVNRELVLLYSHIGRDILARQAVQGWGAKVIERLAHDLRTAFPDMRGFSPRNLKYMRAFAEAWPEGEFVQEVLAQLPWYHQLALLDKLRTAEERRWYAAKAIEHNWSRNVLVIQIENRTGQPDHRAIAVQEPEPGGRRVCTARLEQAHRRGRIPAPGSAARRAAIQPAQHRTDREGTGRRGKFRMMRRLRRRKYCRILPDDFLHL